jgi:isoleucyl-tRNA synthetase
MLSSISSPTGWFYTLMVISTAIFQKPAFKNLIVNGLVLAADGKKMSKRLKNYPAPEKCLSEYGKLLLLYLVHLYTLQVVLLLCIYVVTCINIIWVINLN